MTGARASEEFAYHHGRSAVLARMPGMAATETPPKAAPRPSIPDRPADRPTPPWSSMVLPAGALFAPPCAVLDGSVRTQTCDSPTSRTTPTSSRRSGPRLPSDVLAAPGARTTWSPTASSGPVGGALPATPSCPCAAEYAYASKET